MALCSAVLAASLYSPAAGQAPAAPSPAALATMPAENPPAQAISPALGMSEQGDDAATPPETSWPETPPVPSLADAPTTPPLEGSPPPRRKEILHLDYLDGDLQIESQYDRQKVGFRYQNPYSRPQRQNQTDTVWQIRETLGLRAAGNILDPQWFTYNMALRLAMDQTAASEKSPFGRLRDHGSGWLGDYSFNFGLLQGKPIHFDVYTSREDGRLHRLFLPSLWHEAWRTGITAFFEHDRFPMELTFEQTRDAYSGGIDRFDDEDVEDTLLRYGATAIFTPFHQLRLDYQRDERHERYFGSDVRFHTIQNILRLDDRIQFGSQHQHLWENSLEYQEDDGDLPRNHIDYGSRLAFQHNRRLTTEYKYEYSRDSYGDTTVSTDRPTKSEDVTFDTHRFDWIATWRPREWLTTTGDLFAAHDRSDDGLSSNLFGGLLRVSGNRDNRYGTLSGTAGYEFDYVDTRFSDNKGTPVNETVSFRNSIPAFLAHSDIMTGSIIVTDLNRTQLYILGRDYLFIQSGSYTALVRLPFGRIAENQPVRVFYRYRTTRGGRFQTHQFDARIQQDFKSGWTPYYQVILRRQCIDTNGSFFLEPNNLDQQRLGLTFRRASWLLGAEAEFNDATIDPYNAVRVHGNWTILQNLVQRLAVRGEVSQFWYRNLERREPTVFDLALDYRRSLARQLEANVAALYRHEHESFLGTTNGLDARAGLAYRIGKLTVTADVEYDMLDIAASDQDGVSLWVRVRRDFPNMLGRRP